MKKILTKSGKELEDTDEQRGHQDPVQGMWQMITKDNSDIGLRTRFGPDWPGKRCGAKTRNGGICPKPAYNDSGRCHNHVGASTGAKTKEGRQRLSEAHLKHGRFTKDKRLAKAKGAAIERKLRARRKLIESELRIAGVI